MKANNHQQFNCGCELEYYVYEESTFIFNIAVASTDNQTILTENLVLTPNLPHEEYIEPILHNRFLRVNVPPGKFNLYYQADVELSYPQINPEQKILAKPPSFLPLDMLRYVYPSRYCESDQLFELTFQRFAQIEAGYEQVKVVCDWIHNNITYVLGSSDNETTALETVKGRAGVCRDFAHLAIAMCRALNIPARFVTGYAYKLDPPDFHAYFEVYLDNAWYLFDATKLVPLEGLIRIGTGRDAADVSFATIFGEIELNRMNLWTNLL
ncbi:MAG: transglutaminase family protein [Gloeocapsa sp. DLM2.Bin57]|nr:MAG: transglutaminase family protein [Gloeocapsa sp. DLM2.Bin57]